MQQSSSIVNQKVHEVPENYDTMMDVAHVLTSSAKLKIIRLLEEPRTPESVASDLGITRQGVDKHLKEFIKYGLVEKMWVLTSLKPRVEYKVTEMGRYFYHQMTEVMENYRNRGKSAFESYLKSMDLQLINGEINLDRYQEMRNALTENMAWFLEPEN